MHAPEKVLPEDATAQPAALRAILRAVLEDAPLLLLILMFLVVGLTSSTLVGIPQKILFISWSSLSKQMILYAIPAFLLVLVRAVVVRKQSLVIRDTWGDIFRTMFAPTSFLNFALVFISLRTLMQTFIAFKASIPVFHPFSWDVRFMEWDRWLHFGRHPFVLLQPVLGKPIVTKVIDYVYFLWIPVMWFTAIWQAWHGSRRTPARSQFLLSFAMCWILLGTGMAILLSSAGPVYFGAVTGAVDPYVPLMEYLRTTNGEFELRALKYQALLWVAYQDPETVGLGISAMPSLHIAIAVLMTFLGFSVRPWLGWIYACFAFVIFIGSIHLAWHYAIDGYVSAAAVVVIWWISGRVVRWWRCKLQTAGSYSG